MNNTTQRVEILAKQSLRLLNPAASALALWRTSWEKTRNRLLDRCSHLGTGGG